MADSTTNPSSNDDIDPYSYQDPLPPKLRENDHFLLYFADGRQLFAQALTKWKCSKGFVPCKINKRTYHTHDLIGLPYGTVLEVGNDRGLIPLPEGEDLLPSSDDVLDVIQSSSVDVKNGSSIDANATSSNNNSTKSISSKQDKVTEGVAHNDNRNLIDDNKSQKLTQSCVSKLQSTSDGSAIVAAMISNSSTFGSKTAFSQAKYVKRKQMKYQPRCRIVRITPSTLCSALHLKDPRKISNLRDDTLGQLLSNANICGGSRVLIFDNAVQGLITTSCTRRMGGYGSVYSLYSGQQPSYLDHVVMKMNFTIGEKQSLKWVNLGEVFGDYDEKEEQTKSLCDPNTGELIDVEKRDRESMVWPTPLQPHTLDYVKTDLMNDERKVNDFLARRCARFTRKLTRHSMLEIREMIDECLDKSEILDNTKKNEEVAKMDESTSSTTIDTTTAVPRQCDSLIIATKYDPTATLFRLLPYLAPSCPFVIYHEFLEPLLETFHTLQNYYVNDEEEDDDNSKKALNGISKKKAPMMQQRNIAINLRLTDTWFREYQVLEGRTHPNMTMTQSGGYILMGTKLCPRTGTNELTEDQVKAIRSKVGGKRKQMR